MLLGTKIRDLRQRRSLTMEQLAKASGLSKGFISQVENGHATPSLTTLIDLARALDISAAYLVVNEEPAPHVVRAAERRRVHVGGNTSRVEVLSAQPKRNLELLMAELPPGLSAAGKRHFHHGEECILCLEGRLRLHFGSHMVTLEKGDSCHYDGRVPHAVENCGATTARLLIAMTPAAFEPLIRVPGGTSAEASPPIAST